MNTAIRKYLNRHPRLKQWAWFIALWFAGLLTVAIATYPLKLLIRLAR